MENNSENDISNSSALQDFFISYAVENWAQAKWIHEQLETHGYHTILAGRDFSVGNNIPLEIHKALKTSTRMIAVISPDYLTSPYTQAEWAAVFHRDPNGEQGLLIPIFVQACEVDGLLAPLLRINLIDFIGKDDQQAQKRLLRGVRVAPRTRSLISPSPSQKALPLSSRIWHVPFPRNPLFTGREDLLDQLHQKLIMAGTSDVTTVGVAALTQPQALKGLGGIGKTQLSIEYAYRYQSDYPYTFWINAATEGALITSFVTMADLLPSFPVKGEQDQSKVVEAVKLWLEQSHTRWLLLFDNVEDIALVRSFLPKAGPGHILLTTRIHAVSSIAASIVVEKMSLMEGTCLLLRRVYGLASHLSPMQVLEYASVEDTNEAGNVVAVLDYLPLALDQAGAYIEETGCSFTDYLAVYSIHREELLMRRGMQASEYPEAVATTWSLSFEKVEQANPAAVELLRLCAFLAPDVIPEELIRDGSLHWSSPLRQAAADPFTFNQVIEELQKFSLIERLIETQTSKALRIHRLVQAVQMDRIEINERIKWAERIIRAMNEVFPPDPYDIASWALCRRYLNQAQVCSELIEQYTISFTEAANLLNRTSSYLYEHALYVIAEPLYERALAICEQQLGAAHTNTASILNNLASLYRRQGKYEQAEALYLRALAIYEQQLDATYPQIATGLNNLANLYYDQGKYEQAEPLLERALLIREQQLGAMHPNTASTLNNLGELYTAQGKYEQAEQLYLRALSIREQQLGATHPDTATSLNNLAELYSQQSKYEEVEQLYLQALSIREQQFGATHPDTALILNNLAGLYKSQSKYEQSEQFYQRAFSIYKQQFGEAHPNTNTTLNNLGELYYLQGKYEQAEPLLVQALSVREQQLGATHPDTATSLNNLAGLYCDQGKYEQAEQLYQRALSIYKQLLGAAHPDTALALNNLASLYYSQSKYEQAEPLFLQAFSIREQQLGATHPQTASSLSNLASIYYSQGKYEQAERFYQRALDIDKQVYGHKHPEVATDFNNLAIIYQVQGKYEQAELLFQQAISIYEQQLGPQHPKIAQSLNTLASLYYDQVRYEQAEVLLQRALLIRERILGTNHPATEATRNDYVFLRKAMEHDAEAKKLEGKKAENELRFVCAYCGKETTVIVEVAKPLSAQSKGMTRVYYCEHCNRANRISVPDNVSVHAFILGKDRGFLGYTSNDVPLLQGQQFNPSEEKSLQVRLEGTDQRSNQYTLTFDSSQYSVILNTESNVIISDWLRRLQPVLTGQNDPSDELTSQELMRNVGTWLWQALLPDSAPAQEREALVHVLRTGRTPLLLALPDTLASLPWELLYDSEKSSERGFLALRRPLLRLSASVTPVTPIEPPLRVLLLISSPPSLGEDSRIDVESERAAVEQAVHTIRKAGFLHLLVEDIVTPKRVQRLLMSFQPHIVHYIGHSGYNETSGDVLLWEDEQGNELELSAERFADLLRPRNIHAVVLHARASGRSTARTEMRGFAGTLVHEGIPAILALQANFTYESSQHISEAWYTALTAGQSMALALFEVRQTLVQADRPDWAVPILQGDIASITPILDATSLPGAADPLLTSLGVAADLPAPTGIFVGRHREMRALHLMLESMPGKGPVIALITGPGGIGKSTLAAQAVTHYGKAYKSALTLSCIGYQGVELFLQRISEILKRLSVPDFLEQVLPNPSLRTEAKIEEAIVALNLAGPVLLVIDNLESVQAEDQTLQDEGLLYLLQKLLTNLHGGRVLITGRYAVKNLLPQGKFAANLLHLDLDDLSLYETNQLMLHYDTLSQLGEIERQKLIREFGGLPYVYDLLSTEANSQSLDLLIHDVQGRITEAHQQRSAQEWQAVQQQLVEFVALEATIKSLSESARTLLGQLSVLQQPFPLAAMKQGLRTEQAVWQLLLDRSLLRYDQVQQHYHLHGLTRRYAEEQLLDMQERRQAQEHLARWYERYARQESHDLADYLEAHRLWRAAGKVQLAGNLVMQLAETLRRSGLYPLLRDLCTKTLGDIGESDELLKATTLHTLGIIAQDQGEYEQACLLYQQSLDLSERLGDSSGRATSLHALGIIAQDQGEYEQARHLYQQSLNLFERLGDQRGRASTLHQLGIIAQDQGEYEQARHLYQQSLDLFERLGDQRGRASTLHQLGNIAYSQGEYEQARHLYQQSLDIKDRLGDQSGRATSLGQLGNIAQDQGEYEQARHLYQQSLNISERLGDQRGQASTLHQLGNIAQDQGEYEQARLLYQQSLNISERLGDQRGQANIRVQLGTLARTQGDYVLSRRFYEESLTIFERLGDLEGRANTLVQLGDIAHELSNLGDILVDGKEWDKALGMYDHALHIQQRLGDQIGHTRTQENIRAIYLHLEPSQVSSRVVIAETQHFFQHVGFNLGTTNEPDSFLCYPIALQWKKKIKYEIYVKIAVEQRIDENTVLHIRDAAQKLEGEMKIAFVIVDQTVDERTWMQIFTLRAGKFNLIPIPSTLILGKAIEGNAQAKIDLDKHLERFLGRGVDPYDIRYAVFDVFSFFGREALAHNLVNDLISGQPIGLFGLRKIGKSSLMHFMRNLMPCPTARLDLEAGVEVVQLYMRILRAWQADAQTRLGIDLGLQNTTISSVEPGTEFVRIAQSTLDNLGMRSADPRLALFFDEIELIMPPLDATGPDLELYLSLMRTLRGLVQEDGRFPLMVAGVDPIINRASRWGNEQKQNPFFMLLREFYVPPLLQSDCVQMFRNIGSQMELSYSDEAANAIALASGGHPFLARQLCSLAYVQRNRRPGEIKLPAIQKAINRFMFDNKYTDAINDTGLWGEVTNSILWSEQEAHANQAVLFALAGSIEPVAESIIVNAPGSAALRSALFALEDIHVIHTVEESLDSTESSYAITFGLFKSWIRQIRLGLEG